jgi:hypothetical protein
MMIFLGKERHSIFLLLLQFLNKADLMMNQGEIFNQLRDLWSVWFYGEKVRETKITQINK